MIFIDTFEAKHSIWNQIHLNWIFRLDSQSTRKNVERKHCVHIFVITDSSSRLIDQYFHWCVHKHSSYFVIFLFVSNSQYLVLLERIRNCLSNCTTRLFAGNFSKPNKTVRLKLNWNYLCMWLVKCRIHRQFSMGLWGKYFQPL